MKRVALVHAVKSVYLTFDGQLRERIPGLTVTNTLDEFLLSDFAGRGRMTPAGMNRLLHLLKAAETGRPSLIINTCAALAPAVEQAAPYILAPVISINDGMTRRAVELGERIMILATAPHMVEPTRQRLLREANLAGKGVTISSILCRKADEAVRRLDMQAHDQLVTAAALDIKNQEVVVLAQATMGHLSEPIQRICGCPVLSPTELCLEQAAELLDRKGTHPAAYKTLARGEARVLQ